jgi:hypothetical protein
MMVQKLHWNGQPRPASKLAYLPATRATVSFGSSGNAAASMPGASCR